MPAIGSVLPAQQDPYMEDSQADTIQSVLVTSTPTTLLVITQAT